MRVVETGIPGLVVIQPKIFGDDRGYFLESWNNTQYEQNGVCSEFCQDNMSFSRKGVLRGLHLQNPNGQAKLVSVALGEVYDVSVDLRRGSPTFGRWYGIYLSSEKRNQVFIPKGFAHGFCVVSETALITYKCSNFYNPNTEFSLLWNDPEVAIKWPLVNPELSQKDASAKTLKELPDQAFIEY